MNGCFLAVDTSCYTTSVAVVSEGCVLLDKRIMLGVGKGGRGLRQSEAVFQHIKNLKSIFSDESFKEFNIRAVAYSAKPRDGEKSYMPVFCAGETSAVACAASLAVPAYAFTHQRGHIYSAFFGNDMKDGEYCALHVSGGTLDVLRVRIEGGLVGDVEVIGGTLDITCGQLIDRVGVASGLAFPSGAEMESIYIEGAPKLPVTVRGLNVNLSGAEARAMGMLKAGESKATVCSAALDCAAETLSSLVKNAESQGMKNFIFTGGVICNRMIREKLLLTCSLSGCGCVAADRRYSADNACGLALATEKIYTKGERE